MPPLQAVPPPPRAALSKGAELLAERVAARPPSNQPDCDVLIVGSGYGGAVAAARLAGLLPEVWVLERGREHLPGSFPSSFGQLPGQVRYSRQDGKPARGFAEGLFDLRLGDDVHALVGNGLGGGSLINAGVMEKAHPDVFLDGWPGELGTDEDALAEGYQKAGEMLLAGPIPDPAPLKLDALQAIGQAAEAQDTAFKRCAVAVSFDGKDSPEGVAMRACTRCGDCITGCNQGAKKTLDTNYLALAYRRKASLYCGGWVERIERDEAVQAWKVFWHYTEPRKRPADGQPFCVVAKRVVLAAGSLGSTEILLRSRCLSGLQLSEQLGKGFSTNGDQIAAVLRQDSKVNASREETLDPSLPCTVGPTITGLVTTRQNGVRLAVEEFAVPAPLRRMMGEVTTTFGMLHGLFGGGWKPHPADVDQDELAVTTASLEHTSILGLMGDDGATGQLHFERSTAGAGPATDGQLRVTWDHSTGKLSRLWTKQIEWLKFACGGPGLQQELCDTLCGGAAGNPAPAAAKVGGIVVPSPAWRMLPDSLSTALDAQRGVALTVHPLGGCRMGESVASGVVDDIGRVFNPAGGTHGGLVVLDGAIVPTALGINPSLTIAALAERAIPRLIGTGWITPAVPVAAVAPLPPPHALLPGWQPPREQVTSIRIREQMCGHLKLNGRDYWAELEVPALPIRRLIETLRKQTDADRTVDFETKLNGGNSAPQLRLWEWLPDRRDRRSGKGVQRLLTATLSGSVRLFARVEASTAQKQTAWLDAAAVVAERVRANLKRDDAKGEASIAALLSLVLAGNELAQRRTLVYRLVVDRVDDGDGDLTGVSEKMEFVGTKTIHFAADANPWRQLMEMDLAPAIQRPAGGPTVPGRSVGVLKTDLGYFARYREALFSLIEQRDHPSALMDLASFGLYVLRLLVVTHWPHFIPPGDAPQHIAERLPDRLDGQLPVIYPLFEGARLSRYRPRTFSTGTRPLLMIHGLSAAGSTFAHPSIPRNLVRFMLEQGRDVWVVDLRTSSGNQLPAGPRRGPFKFEDVAMGDIPDAIQTILSETGESKVDVIAHCIGAVMFCLATLQMKSLHASIGHAVLSQVGPLTEMSPFNRLRGYLASFLQQYLMLDEVDVRPEFVYNDTADKWELDPVKGQRQLLTDALLATFPYLGDDLEAARAARLDHDFRLVRHRADAIIGQTFQLENMADETLLALDAIYGWVKTQTLAQTLHMARERLLTDADGDNRSVSGVALADCFDFAVLLLHGRLNEVFDWQGSLRSYQLLKRVFDEPEGAITSNGDIHLGQGSPRQLIVLDRYGHQDCMIGKDAHQDVFPRIERFLQESDAASRDSGEQQPRFVCEQPWMGPMLGWLRGVAGAPADADMSVLVHAGRRHAETLCVVFVPLFAGPPGAQQAWQPQWHLVRGFNIDDGRDDQPRQRERLLAHALTVRLNGVVDALGATPSLAFAVLTLHRDLQDRSRDENNFFITESVTPRLDDTRSFQLTDEAIGAVKTFLAATDPRQLVDLLLCLEPRQLAARDVTLAPPQKPFPDQLAFAVGSCQFPPALFDKVLAANTYRGLDSLLNGGMANLPMPAFLLQLGDQVYLDALGNVFESPAEEDDNYARRPYETNWRLQPLRRVVSRLPVYPILDDHEIADDWQPPVSAALLSGRERAALAAYHCYQGKLAPPCANNSGSLSYAFAPAGLPVFVLDTRTQRQARTEWPSTAGACTVDSAQILARADMDALKTWLLKHRDAKAPVIFVATPSVVLPFEGAGLEPAERLRFDSWSGYPLSLYDLLHFIDANNVPNVVFLSGDSHLSLAVQFEFESRNRVFSIVSSGFYTPWPFANDRIEDLMQDGPCAIKFGAGKTIKGTLTRYGNACSDAGLALIDFLNAAQPQLTVHFTNRHPPVAPCTILLQPQGGTRRKRKLGHGRVTAAERLTVGPEHKWRRP